ncbi:MAG: hydantoinase B/oxoprolinase family protein [Actinobacteria bacterium]|nr:hydantoinase B/oxoprolinase family protein [Actinomycetota bacterium]
MVADNDPITLTVIWNRLIAIGNEMGLTLSRTAFSDAVREAQDFGPHVYDAKGRLVAQGLCSPGHLGASLAAVRHALAAFPEETLEPGDAVIFNLPGMGTGHLLDFVVVTPAFMRDGQIVGFTASSAHQADIGGITPGSQHIPNVADLFQEGIIIPPSLLVRRGEPTEIFRMILANVRMPEVVEGDVNAQLNANQVGARGIVQLAERYGPDALSTYTEEIIRRSEEAMRASVRELPNGVYEGEDYMDDYGPGTPPIRVYVTVTIEDEDITVDFSGSSEQVPAAMNAYLSYTYAYVFYTLKCVVNPELPQNEGTCRPVHATGPAGCFFNAQHPAPSSGRAITAHRMFNAIMLAISKAVPHRAVACHSEFSNAIIGGKDPRTGRTFAFYEILSGGSGGRPTKDGVEAMFTVINAKNVPVEVYETSNPVLIERAGLVQDSAGAGKFRGGCGFRRDSRIIAPEVTFTNLSDRTKFDPYGLQGGLPGMRGATYLNPGTENEELLEPKGVYTLHEGDVISYRCAGAGGYGDPLERDIAAVARDVDREFVSIEAAARLYGVVVDPETLSVDKLGTEQMRTRMRRDQAFSAEMAPETGAAATHESVGNRAKPSTPSQGP